MSTQHAQPAGSPDRRLERAREHVSRLWFPADPALVRKIRAGLEDGTYDLDVDFLVNEIKDDFALFTWCLKGLAALLAQEKAKLPPQKNPVALLRWAGVARIKRLFQKDGDTISVHELDTSTDFQAARMREAVVSAATAGALAPRLNVDEEISFSAALLRQLGHSLIAWNYPTVYRRCLGSPGETSIDDALTRALGFSPSLLALSLVRQWGLDEGMRSAVAGKADGSVEIMKLCRIGEALARANEPEVYPDAARDWATAREEIEKTLGHEGLRIIQERVRSACAHYQQLVPKLFNELTQLDPARRIHTHLEGRLLDGNPAARACSPALRKLLRELYARLVPGEIDRGAVDLLVKDIIPACGFTGGAIYILDPTSMTLVPRLRFGAVALRRVETVRCPEHSTSTDPVVTAFRCQSPISEHGTGSLGFIVGSVGVEQRAGAIYVEAPETLFGEDSQMLLNTFKAVRQALNDCLGLE